MGQEQNKKQPNQSDAETTSPFQCSICGRTFDTRDELLRHEKTHMGEQVGATGTSDAAAAEDAGMPTEGGEKPLPFAGERGGWTTGTGDREEGEITGRQTPGGRNAGFSGDAGLDNEKE